MSQQRGDVCHEGPGQHGMESLTPGLARPSPREATPSPYHREGDGIGWG